MNAELLTRLAVLTQITGAALLLVLLLRPLVRRLGGAGLVYASWLLVPLVLLTSILPQPAQAPLPAPKVSVQWVITTATTLPDLPSDSAGVCLAVWLVGALIALLAFGSQQVRFQRGLGKLQSLGDGVQHLASESFVGPLLIGLLRPKIVLPADFFSRYNALEQALILAHERVHLRRHDSAANLLTTLFQILFWFNPLVHVAAGRLRFDQELACDAAVLRQHPGSRSSYAGAILKASLIESTAPLACHWQSRHPLKERILELSHTPPERARRFAAQSLLVSLTLCACYTAWATTERAAPSISVPALAEKASTVVVSKLATTTEPVAPTVEASNPKPVKALLVHAAKDTAPAEKLAALPADGTATSTPASLPTSSPAASTATEPPQSAELYKVQFEMTMKSQINEVTTNRHSANFAIAVRPGEAAQVKFLEGPQQCTLGLKLTPLQDQMVFLDLPLQCSGQASNPKIQTRLGEKASIRIGDAEQFTQIAVVVTH